MGPLFAGAFMPLDFVSSVLVSVFLTGVLSALAYWKGVLTWDGSLAAFVVGMVIGIFGDVTWLFLLLFFLLSSFLATRYRFALKEALGVQEGARSERPCERHRADGHRRRLHGDAGRLPEHHQRDHLPLRAVRGGGRHPRERD